MPNGLTQIGTEVSGTDLCANIVVISYSSKLVLKVSNKKMNLVAGRVMKGSMVFCKNNILEHSMSFHGDYNKRCLLTNRVSEILLLTQLISEIKYIHFEILHSQEN